MRLLTEVDVDEVSPVVRAANKRRVVLKEEEMSVDSELKDIMGVPWEREGALLDEIRKEVNDETVDRAFVAGIRLLKGIESALSPELIEKLGTELYGHKNPKLNSSSADAEGDLTGSGSGGSNSGSASGAKKDGKGRDGELIGRGKKAPKVAADPDNDASDEPDGDDDDVKKSESESAKSWITRSARALGILPDSGTVSKADEETSDSDMEMSELDQGEGTVEILVPVRKEDGTWDLSGVPSESRPFYEEMILKADETQKELKETKELLAKSDDELKTKQMVEKAAAFSHVAPTDDLAPILKAAASSMDEETFGKLQELLAAAEDRISKGSLFDEMGRVSRGDAPEKQDAYAEAVKKADEMIEKSSDLSLDQALTKVWDQNPDLYTKYLFENGMGVR